MVHKKIKKFESSDNEKRKLMLLSNVITKRRGVGCFHFVFSPTLGKYQSFERLEKYSAVIYYVYCGSRDSAATVNRGAAQLVASLAHLNANAIHTQKHIEIHIERFATARAHSYTHTHTYLFAKQIHKTQRLASSRTLSGATRHLASAIHSTPRAQSSSFFAFFAFFAFITNSGSHYPISSICAICLLFYKVPAFLRTTFLHSHL